MHDLKFAYKYGGYELIKEDKLQNRKDPTSYLKYYPGIKFNIALYKDPFSIIMNAYFPMFVLSLLTLMIYLQEFQAGDRIANISVLLLAFVAFIPTVRSIIPPVNYFTLADFVIFCNFLGTGFVMIETLIQVRQKDALSESRSQLYTYVFFGLSAMCFALPNAIVLILYFLHMVVWKKSYSTKIKAPPLTRGDDNDQTKWYNLDVAAIGNERHLRVVGESDWE